MSSFVDIEDMAGKDSSFKPLKKERGERKMKKENRKCSLLVTEGSSAWSELNQRETPERAPTPDDMPELERVEEEEGDEDREEEDVKINFREAFYRLAEGRSSSHVNIEEFRRVFISSRAEREGLSLMNTKHIHPTSSQLKPSYPGESIVPPLRIPDDEILLEINASREEPATKAELKNMSDQVGSLAESFSQLISGRKAVSQPREERPSDRVTILSPDCTVDPIHQERRTEKHTKDDEVVKMVSTRVDRWKSLLKRNIEEKKERDRIENSSYPSRIAPDGMNLFDSLGDSSTSEPKVEKSTPRTSDEDMMKRDPYTYMQSSISTPESVDGIQSRVYTAKGSYSTIESGKGLSSEDSHSITAIGREALMSRDMSDLSWNHRNRRTHITSKRSIIPGRSVFSSPPEGKEKSLGNGKTYIASRVQPPTGPLIIIPSYGPLRPAPGHEYREEKADKSSHTEHSYSTKEPNISISESEGQSDEDETPQTSDRKEESETHAAEFDGDEGSVHTYRPLIDLTQKDKDHLADMSSTRRMFHREEDEQIYADDSWFSPDAPISDEEMEKRFDEAMNRIMEEEEGEEDNILKGHPKGGSIMKPISGFHRSREDDFDPDIDFTYETRGNIRRDWIFRFLNGQRDEQEHIPFRTQGERQMKDPEGRPVPSLIDMKLSPSEEKIITSTVYAKACAAGEVPSPPKDPEPNYGGLGQPITPMALDSFHRSQDWEKQLEESKEERESFWKKIEAPVRKAESSRRGVGEDNSKRLKMHTYGGMYMDIDVAKSSREKPPVISTKGSCRVARDPRLGESTEICDTCGEKGCVGHLGKIDLADPIPHGYQDGFEKLLDLVMELSSIINPESTSSDGGGGNLEGKRKQVLLRPTQMNSMYAFPLGTHKNVMKGHEADMSKIRSREGIQALSHLPEEKKRSHSPFRYEGMVDDRRERKYKHELLIICPKNVMEQWRDFCTIPHSILSMINIHSLLYATPSPIPMPGTFASDIGNLLGRGQKESTDMMFRLLWKYQGSESKGDGEGWIYSLLVDQDNHTYSPFLE